MAEPCNAYESRLSALLDGALSAQDQAAVEDHLAACGDCSARLADLAPAYFAQRERMLGAKLDHYTALEQRQAGGKPAAASS